MTVRTPVNVTKGISRGQPGVQRRARPHLLAPVNTVQCSVLSVLPSEGQGSSNHGWRQTVAAWRSSTAIEQRVDPARVAVAADRLETPSSTATESATALLQKVRYVLKGLELDRKHELVQSVLRGLFRYMFKGAGHSPEAPGQDGWIQLGCSPALTQALGSISQHYKVTVGNSVECVA